MIVFNQKNKDIASKYFGYVSDGIAPFCLALFGLGAIFSVFGLNGILRGHLGWAGPDLYGPAINLKQTGYFFARGIYVDGSFDLYNHHPPLGFWYFHFFSRLASGTADKLAVAYYGAVIAYLFGWWTLFKLLQKLNFRSDVAATSLLFIATFPLFLSYRAIINFDCFSILCSCCLLTAFSKFELSKKPLTPKEFIQSISLLLFTIAVSWYSLPIIGVFFSWLLCKRFRKPQLRNEILKAGLIVGCGIAAILAYMIAAQFILYHSLGDFFVFIKADAALESPIEDLKNPFTLALWLNDQITLITPSNLILIILAIAVTCIVLLNKKKHRILSTPTLQQLPWASANSILIGVILFVTATRYWSAVHPFALLFLAAPFVFFMSVFFTYLFDNKRMLLLSLLSFMSIYSFYLFAMERRLDVIEQERTQALLTLIDHEFPSGYAFPETGFRKGCGIFHTGALTYALAYPNKWISASDKSTYPNRIDVECIDRKKNILSFHSIQKGKTFVIRPDDPEYETIADQPKR